MAAKDKKKKGTDADETPEGAEETSKPEGEAAPEGEGGEGAPAKKSPLAFLDALPIPPALKLPVLIGAPVLLILLIVLGLFLGGVFSPKKAKKVCADQTQTTDQTTAPAADDKDKAKTGDDKSAPTAAQPDCVADQTEATDDNTKTDPNAKPVYYNLPDMLVNLESHGRKAAVLKLSVTFELTSADDQKAMEDKMPVVVDEFQVFLREVRVEDLRGSAGIYRLRQELLARVKPAVAPIKVKDVLFKELLIQ